jgi:2-dehydro-3-deoxyphosphogluconate aldolase / (4S)-4-hydroxy-2-oxoglutarate aldolase
MNLEKTLITLLRDGFILVFNQDKLDIVKTAEALMRAGINNMEVTCRISDPLEKIARLRKALPDFVAGAASLVDNPRFLEIHNSSHPDDTLASVDEVVDAGANYLVSAVHFGPETYQKYAGKLLMIPGCGTVSEIVSQFSLGANFIKIFPARQLGGPAFVKAIDPAIHKTISIVPTGGTNRDNIPDYVDAGILVLGGSFGVIPKETLREIMDNQDYNLLSDELSRIKKLIDEVRAKRWPEIDFSNASVEQISKQTGRNFNL